MVDEKSIQQWISGALGFLKGEHPEKEQFAALTERLAKFAESCKLSSTPLTRAGMNIIYFSDKPVEMDVFPGTLPMLYQAKETNYREEVLAGIDLANRLAIHLRIEEEEEEEEEAYSEPRPPSAWAKLFGTSWRTITRRIGKGEIRAIRINNQSWRIHLDDVPETIVDKKLTET